VEMFSLHPSPFFLCTQVRLPPPLDLEKDTFPARGSEVPPSSPPFFPYAMAKWDSGSAFTPAWSALSRVTSPSPPPSSARFHISCLVNEPPLPQQGIPFSLRVNRRRGPPPPLLPGKRGRFFLLTRARKSCLLLPPPPFLLRGGRSPSPPCPEVR